jgi:hypothetical protein
MVTKEARWGALHEPGLFAEVAEGYHFEVGFWLVAFVLKMNLIKESGQACTQPECFVPYYKIQASILYHTTKYSGGGFLR